MKHLTHENLVNYIENHLDEAMRSEVKAHLALPCALCQRQVIRLRTVLDAMATDTTVAPPASVLKRAVALHKNQAKSAPSPIARVLAALQFDSRLQLSAMPSRGAGRARQMLFSTEQADIDIKITPGRGEHNLVGQVLDSIQVDKASKAFVSLHGETGDPLMGTETDAHGQFTLRKIPSGIYALVVDFGNQEVAITGLELVE